MTELYGMDGEEITRAGCLSIALAQLELATYNAHGDMDKIATATVAQGWILLAQHLPEKIPEHLG